MLKKVIVLSGLIIVMLLAFAGAVAAEESGEANKVYVYFDNELMEFEVEPFIEKGSTQVPFRPIFEKLGLEIGWDADTKTVTGEREGLSIALQIGSKTAVVNGEELEMAVAPVLKNGYTFIPLRFVIEHSDKDVSWHGRERVVYIADTADQVKFVFGLHYEYANQGDIEGVISTVSSDSPGYQQTAANLNQTLVLYDLQIEISDVELIALTEDEAVIQAAQTTVKLAGPEFEDNRSIAQHLLVKQSGQWKLYYSELLFIAYLRGDLAVKGELTTSEADQQAIREVLEASLANAKNEDNEAERLLYMADYPDLDQTLAAADHMMAVFDLEFKYSDIEFLSGTDSEATVKYRMLTRKLSGPEFPDTVTGHIMTFKKDTDGKWKYAAGDIISMDYRPETIESF